MQALLFLFVSLTAFANLQSVSIKDLDLDYSHPQGFGEVEKFGISLSAKSHSYVRYPLEIRHEENSLKVMLQMLEFNWINPYPFIAEAKKIKSRAAFLQLKIGESFLNAKELQFISSAGTDFSFSGVEAQCQGGSSRRDPIQRLTYDCIEKARVKMARVEIPLKFLDDLAQELPPVPDEAQIPADDFGLAVDNGKFFSHLKVKMVLRATLRIWGHAQFENNHETLAVRVDQIKYGILPVTGLVMNELRRQIKHPDVTITPPWIRINLGKK
jgi:hypothetical protein